MRNDRALIERVARRHRLATIEDVRSAGLTEAQWERLRAHDVWLPVVPGVWRHEATELTWSMKVVAGSQWLGRDAALHGESAIHWLGVSEAEPDRVGFLVPRARRHLPPWLDLHTTLQWSRGDLVTVNGVRTSSATRAIIDMARKSSPARLEAVIDEAVRLRRTSVPTLSKRMAALGGSGRSGIRTLRELLLDSGGESHLERRFLRLMRAAGLPRPQAQVVHRGRGEQVIRVDFRFPNTSLVVEVSGRRGHATDRDRARDARRRNDFQRSGLLVLEFTTGMVMDDPADVVATIRAELPIRVVR